MQKTTEIISTTIKYTYKLRTLIILFCVISVSAQEYRTQNVFCNPINLSYRFQPDAPSRREAADPSVVMYKDKYYMFASKSGGYWASDNLVDWKLVTSNDLPLEDYAPTALVMDGKLYFMALNRKIYQSDEPMSGKWKIIKDSFELYAGDPCLFLDDDNRLYLYHGLTNSKPIRGIELNKNTFQPVGEEKALANTNPGLQGWERTGNYNTDNKRPFLEGAWMTKHNGLYYLQYATPGTQFKSYNDGLSVANSPLGPFTPAVNNPFSYKPEGFICSAGHGSTFCDKWGNYWHAATMLIGIKHRFERRLGLFPAFFDNDQNFYTYTGFGDFPHRIPHKKMKSPDDYAPSAMLLSYRKPIEASSSLTEHPAELANNESIQDYWSATSGNKGEWLMIDLQNQCNINYIQLNFYDESTNLFSRSSKIYYQYLIEYSNDKKHWKILEDKRQNSTDCPHDFIALKRTVKARFVKITNYHIPDGKFALSGFRIFGKGTGKLPEKIQTFSVVRDSIDKRNVSLHWSKNCNTTGYNIRYGHQPDKLYLNYQTFNRDSIQIHSLNAQQKYYFTIDSFNENGITKGNKILVTN